MNSYILKALILIFDFCVIFVLELYFKKKKNYINIKNYLLLIYFMFIFLSLLFLNIIEKSFKFNTIEQCIKYTYPNDFKVMDYYETDNNALVIICNEKECYDREIKKENNKYLFISPIFKLNQASYKVEACLVSVIKSNNSNLAELKITCVGDGYQISDTINSNFKDGIDNNRKTKISGFTSKYLFLNDIPEDYKLIINEKELSIK